MRDSFVFYRSFYEAISELDDHDRLEVYDAICQYALYGTEPEVSGVALAIFKMAKPQIDANNKRFENGKRGGRPAKQGETDEKPKQNQSKTKEKPNDDQTETKSEPNVNVNVNENVNDKKDIVEIIDHLNRTCGTNYKATSATTQKHIRARLRDGFTLNDFKTVIDKKAREWLKDEKMRAYLRPETLFGTRFESYLNQIESGGGGSGFKGFEQRQYDYGEIQRRLVAKGGT